jgi:hypothetical protein
MGVKFCVAVWMPCSPCEVCALASEIGITTATLDAARTNKNLRIRILSTQSEESGKQQFNSEL